MGLARALRRSGVDPLIIVPAARALDDLDPRLPLCRLAPVASRAEASAAVAEVLRANRFDGWVSDVFPNGPANELTDLPLPPAVLVGRAHRDGHTRAFVKAAARYRRVLDTEPHLAWFGGPADRLSPMVRRPEAAADALPLRVLIVADDPALARFAERLSTRLAGRVGVAAEGVLRVGDRSLPSHPRLLDRVCPEVLVGPAGYHLTYEAMSAGIVHLALPRPRRFDVQAARADTVAMRIRSIRELGRCLTAPPARRPGWPLTSFAEAADRVLRALSSG